MWICFYTEAPSPPQELRSRVLEYDNNYSTVTVEVTWNPPGNDSRVEYYVYQVIDSLQLEGVNASLYEANTTNTTVILSGIMYDNNISFILLANNYCEAGNSAPTTLIINIGKIFLNIIIIIGMQSWAHACIYYIGDYKHMTSMSTDWRNRPQINTTSPKFNATTMVVSETLKHDGLLISISALCATITSIANDFSCSMFDYNSDIQVAGFPQSTERRSPEFKPFVC